MQTDRPGKTKSEESHRTAQPPTLAAFLPWGSSEGAGRMTLTGHKSNQPFCFIKDFKENYFFEIGTRWH